MPSFLTPALEKIIYKSSKVDYLKLEDMCSQMVHLSASEPLQVLRAVYLKLASSYFPAPKIEIQLCQKKLKPRLGYVVITKWSEVGASVTLDVFEPRTE